MKLRGTPNSIVAVTGFALLLLLMAATSAFCLGLEKGAAIVPSGLNGDFVRPSGLWYDRFKDRLLVADADAHRVVVLDRAGNVVKLVGKEGTLRFPRAVAANRTGTLFIAEQNGESLKVLPTYDAVAEEQFRLIDLAPYRRSTAVQPVALFVDGEGSLYVADRGNRQLLVFGDDEKLRFTIPDLGEPAAVWVDASGKIMVADPGFGGVRIYGGAGNWLRTVGSYSSQFREPLRAKGVVSDRLGRIWVVEEGNRGIKAVDSLGNLLFSRSGTVPGMEGFLSPAGLAIDPQDNLLVLDQAGGRITVYRITEF